MQTTYFNHRGVPVLSSTMTQQSLPQFDFHNHLLVGVDDGVSNIEEAKDCIKSLKGAGFNGAVITPHIYWGVHNNAEAPLRASFASMLEELSAETADFPLHLAAEYFTDEHFLELIQREELISLSVDNERWVLIEFPYFYETPFIPICISALVARGYRPVIAHVERYRYVADAPAFWLDRFARAGAILQGDIGSLAGQHGAAVRRFAVWLLARNLIQIWGSDLHKPPQFEAYIRPGLRRLTALGRLNGLLGKLGAVAEQHTQIDYAPAASVDT